VLISEGLKQKSQIISQKTEKLTEKILEKREIQSTIARLKKEIL
jgi:hypothetical protein